jgi:uncharacterized membrane protein
LFVLAVTAAALVAGFGIKARCLDVEFDNSREYSRLCYSDLQKLSSTRDLDTFYPESPDEPLEYPALTQSFAYLTARLTGPTTSFFIASALALGAVALGISAALYRTAGGRAIYWALAPSLVLNAFHNWDLPAVALVVLAIYLWRTGSPTGSAISLAAGGAVKLYPLVLLVPLAVSVAQRAGSKARGARVFLSGLGAFAAINAPFLIASPDGWAHPILFQMRRGPNFDSVWNWLPGSAGSATTVSALLLALSIGYVVARMLRGGVDFVQASAALVCLFIAFSKVQSPQYALWVLPFFCLLRVERGFWAIYEAVNVAVFLFVFEYFGSRSDELGFYGSAAIVTVFVRVVLLVALAQVFLGAEQAIEGPEDRSLPRPDLLDDAA